MCMCEAVFLNKFLNKCNFRCNINIFQENENFIIIFI